jgi:hypothetical protein
MAVETSGDAALLVLSVDERTMSETMTLHPSFAECRLANPVVRPWSVQTLGAMNPGEAQGAVITCLGDPISSSPSRIDSIVRARPAVP